MKNKIVAFIIGIALIPSFAFATPTSLDYAGGVLQPLLSQMAAQFKASYFTATSTTATSTFPHASSTSLRVNKLFDTTGSLGSSGYVPQSTGSGWQWGAVSVSGDGVSNWLYNGSRLSPSTTAGIGVFASSTIGGGTGVTGLTINGSATTTGFKDTSLTASRAIFTGADKLFTTTGNSQALIDSLSDETGTGFNVFSASPTFTGTAIFATASSSYASTTGLTAQNAYLTNLTLGCASCITDANVSDTLTASAVPVGGITGLGTGVATWLATPSSANLASAVTGETGTGALVFGTLPTFSQFLSQGSSTIGDATQIGGLTVNGGATTTLLSILGTGAVPLANDGGALGAIGRAFSDLFLASGAVINIANDWIATHSAGILTVGTGDLRVTTAGTNSASVVTVGGTQTLTAKTLTSPTINAGALSGIFTGSMDNGGMTAFEIPNGTGPSFSATGTLAYDETAKQLLVGTSTSPTPRVIRTDEEIYLFSVPSTSATFATGTLKYFPKISDGYTITEIWCGVEGGTSKIATIIGTTLTCTTGNGASTTNPTIPTVLAGSTTVGMLASTTVGVVNWLNVSVRAMFTRQ